MKISMAGVDYKNAPLALRERLAFSKRETEKIIREIKTRTEGCVIVATCNRTEIYVSDTKRRSAAELLFDACGQDAEVFSGRVYEKYDNDAALHLAEVACGLHSAILCEEQIVTQIGEAAELSRLAGCSDAALNTMFRCAVTAGKRALTEFAVRAVPLSAAHSAITRAQALYGSLEGKRALIIGNGKIGILAAEELLGKGCEVCITLRQYRHGENTVPTGSKTLPYSERMRALGEYDFVITATRSPHHTIYVKELPEKLPDYIFDLAVPRDVEAGTEKYVRCFTIDDLTDCGGADAAAIESIKMIAAEGAEDYRRWTEYREGSK